jgi:MFS family permease
MKQNGTGRADRQEETMAYVTKADMSAESTGWYAGLAPIEKRTFWACFGGWTLDAMDVMTFSLVIPAVIVAFNLTNADAGLIGTVTLLTSAFGGWLAGILADRFGRVRILQFTIVWFAFFTFLCGFAQSYWQLFTFRALMGLGFGGEWAAGAVLMGEIIRAQHRGKAVGSVQSGWAIGWAIAVLIATLFFSILPRDIAWRAVFWIGLIPAFLVFFIRRFVKEPPVFTEMKLQRATAGSKSNFLEIFSPSILKTTVLTSILAIGVQGGYYAITTWLPTYLKTERHLTVLGTGSYLAVIILGSFAGYLSGAYLSDWIGRRANFILFAVCSILTVFVYTLLPIDDTMMLILGFPLGFFASGANVGMGAFLTECFPTRVRGSGQGFAYNFGRGIAAFYPLFVGLLSAKLPLGQSIGVFAGTAYGILIVAALLLPETKGRILEA